MDLQLPDGEQLALLESPDPIERFRAATRLADQLEDSIRELQQVRAAAAAELSGEGRSYRDIGELFGISAQRVGQMVGRLEGVTQLIKAWSELESKLQHLAAEAGLTPQLGSVRQLIRKLQDAQILDDDLVEDLLSISSARNTGVHVGALPSDQDVEELLDRAIASSSTLETILDSLREDREYKSEEREEAERLLRRVRAEHPDTAWRPGRCEECGRAIPVPEDGELWVCSQRCLEAWKLKLYSVVDPGSVEEASTLTPRVVPYWI